MDSEQSEIGLLIRRTTDAFARLVREHLELARIEISREGREIRGDVVRVAIFVPFLVVGYAILMVGVSIALVPPLGAAGAFLVVGVVNLLVGGIGTWRALRALESRSVLDETLTEIDRTRQALSREQRVVGGDELREQ